MVQYLSGRRNGDRVTIEARVYTKPIDGVSYANCLGQWAHLDQWASIMPAGSARFYFQGEEVTANARYIQYYPAGQITPEHDVGGNRYDRGPQNQTAFNDDGSLRLDANSGCIIAVFGDYPQLDATFTFTRPPAIEIEYLEQQTFTFQTYIGVGNAGAIDSLRDQMADRYGNRHDKFALSIPAEADYVFVNYPQTPVSAYGNGPITNPASGTYRLADGQSVLSTDHLVSMGLPVRNQWRDADQSGSVRFLPEITNVNTLAAPEYFVPAGFAYDPCMSNGGCSGALLEEIHEAEMRLTVYYYRVTRIEDGLDRIPLRLVGRGYARTAPSDALQETRVEDEARQIFIPFASTAPSVAPDEADGCPCGWFDGDGRMLDFIARP
jgi:hypothetical protein